MREYFKSKERRERDRLSTNKKAKAKYTLKRKRLLSVLKPEIDKLARRAKLAELLAAKV